MSEDIRYDYPISQPHIVLTIPTNLCSDFLGIMALDVLHDAKGRGYLAGHKLSQLTDLLAESIMSSNQHIELNRIEIQNYIFTQVLLYFIEFWSDNIAALGLEKVPDVTISIDFLRDTVLLPIRKVAERDTEDTFANLGKNKYGTEAQNYYDQREKLTRNCAETLSFISPKGINKPADYFRQASGIVDIIKQRTVNAKIVLDMKSAAGLLRTLTDPIGYTTGLPTFADPGYNMPGMSAIRQYADIAFISDQHHGHYNGSSEFQYCVKLCTPLHTEPLTLLDVIYFHGVSKDGLDRNNVLISVLGETFNNSLPRSMTMAESLGKYLNPSLQEHTMSSYDALATINHIVWDYYDNVCPQLNNIAHDIYSSLHHGNGLSTKLFNSMLVNTPYKGRGNSLYKWCVKDNTIFRTSYILSTIQNFQYFNIKDYLPTTVNCLFPEQMITTTLPAIMYEYITGTQNMQLLAFSRQQLELLDQYNGHPTNGIEYQEDLANLLSNQWIQNRKGKLVTQINKHVKEWQQNLVNCLEPMKEYITEYVQSVIQTFTQNTKVIIDVDYNDSEENIETLLKTIPEFKPSIVLEQILTDYLHFYNPDIYTRSAGVLRNGLLASILIEIVLYNPSLELNIDLQTMLTAHIHSSADEHYEYYTKYDALRSVIGKFSGDFGQIVWCICYGHIFASEDNNTSAMALMLHRIPKNYITVNAIHHGTVWGNIHGLGDGSCVDVTINKGVA